MSSQERRTSLEEDPGNWSLRNAFVESLVAEGNHDAAVEIVNAGEAIPREAEPWLEAAKAYAAVGALQQAKDLVAGSLEIDPEYAPALEYQEQVEAAIAATPVALSLENVDDEEEVTDNSDSEAPIASVSVGHANTDDPIALPQVSFSSNEMDAIHAAEEESKKQREKTISRDKMNSILITVVVHVAIIALLTFVATKSPPRVPPQIVASSAAPTQEEVIENVKMDKPTVEPTAVNSAVADIISVSATSSFSVSNVDVQVTDMAVETGVSFSPSMSLGMPTNADSKMMFGQEMEGEVLGVILDVSGSMAEYLPAVVREVDKNFKDAPIVYVRNMLIRANRNGAEEVRLVIPEDVVPTAKDEYGKTYRTPYWFLWGDLPRKAPQRYVDRLIETFKTRPNQFLTTGRWDRGATDQAIDFLMEQGIDSLYVFSDYEDFVDEDIALELGQKLGRRKIRTYLQPAEGGTEFLDIMTKKIANRTLGRQMPSLVSLMSGKLDEQPVSLTMQKPEEDTTLADLNINLATPREEAVTTEWYASKPSQNWTEIHRIVEPEYDAVFYGPQARVHIHLKDANGKYIQNPIYFGYHSYKRVFYEEENRYRTRGRKFLRLAEEPSFDGKELIWKMILEDEVQFDVHLYIGRKGMNATYVAEIPSDGLGDGAYIYFAVPPLAREREDRYFGFDFPQDGLKLDHVREANKANELIMNLPRQFRDRYAKNWAERGFEMGYNTRHFDDLIRHLPSGIRDMEVKGPSFGPRVFSARTTSSKILLHGGAYRADIEPWEGFHARLARPGDTRERFTKTEAIEIEIK